MKTKRFFAVLAMGFAIAACSQNAEPAAEPAADAEGTEVEVVKTSKDYLPSKATVDSVSYLVGVNFGSFIKNYNFGDLNYSQIIKGIKDFVAAKGDPRSEEFIAQLKMDPNKMNELFNSYLEARQNYTSCLNKEKGEKFLAENAKKPGMVVSESGLQYRIMDAGNDNKPSMQDTVFVKYCGKLIDGTVFDETDADAEPMPLTLNRVIRAWTEGLQYIGEGGKIELYVPAELGYGERGTQGIEPNSVLTFTVELAKVGKFVAPEMPAE